MVGGLLAGIVFKQVWRRASPGDRSDPPKALESEYDLKEILIAATLQWAIYSLVKTLIDRGGSRAVQGVPGNDFGMSVSVTDLPACITHSSRAWAQHGGVVGNRRVRLAVDGPEGVELRRQGPACAVPVRAKLTGRVCMKHRRAAGSAPAFSDVVPDSTAA